MSDAILYDSPVGTLYISASSHGLTQIKFHPGFDDVPEGNSRNCHLVEAKKQLDQYFDGTRLTFELALDWTEAPSFHKLVWSELLKIPYGKTVAYSDIANDLNNPKAVRAVGMANGRNPLPIVVPCHRVIGKGGNLHGFTGGMKIKEHLLHIENPTRYPIQQALF